MKTRLKSVVSVMLCFLLVFGQVSPLAAVGDILLSENDNTANVSKSISESVYGVTPTSTPVVSSPENTNDAKTIENKLVEEQSLTISGTVSLPMGVIAPPEGINVDVYATNGSNTTKVNVSIPWGADKASYSIVVNSAPGYRVYYQTTNTDYLSPMYCGYMGMVRSNTSSAVYDLTDSSKTVEVKLVPMKIISGKLKLADKNESVTLRLIAECGKDKKVVSVDLKNGEADFRIPVPPNSDSGYLLSYLATNNDKIVATGYYSSSGTVRFKELATLINVSNDDRKDLSFEVIKKKTISGTISLPDGAVIPDSGVVLTLNATFGVDSASTTVTITKSNPSPSYTIYVPQGNEYKVKYQLNNFPKYMSTGYYSTTGTQADQAKASLVNVSTEDKNNIDIKVIALSCIYGEVMLPEGLVAPEKGVEVIVWAVTSTTKKSETVIVPKNQNPNIQSSVPYTIYVPAGTGYKLLYETKDDRYVSKGYYYNQEKVVRDEKTATIFGLSVNENKNIDLTLIDKKVISGKIKLPGKAEGPIDIKMTAKNGSEEYSSDVFTIGTGQESLEYSMLVAPASNYIVQCELIEGGIKYIKNTYYGSGGKTVYDQSFASKIDALSAGQPNIDFNIMEKRKVTGTISLPEGYTAPYDMIITHTDKVDGRKYTTLMPEGSRSVSYTKYVHPQTFINYFEFPENDEFVEKVYYSDTGTVVDESAATVIDARNGDVAGKDFVWMLKNIVSGKVVLKNGKAPDEGMAVNVKIEGKRDKNSIFVMIPGGEKEADFSMTVTPGDDYKIWYESDKETTNVVSKMYYSKGFMVKTLGEAAPLDLLNGSLSNINLTVCENRLISGTISIPQGDSITSAIGMKVLVENIANPKDITTQDLFMPISGAVQYNVYVPAENQYTVKYQLNSENNEYVKEGYLGLSGTEVDKNSAQILNLSDSNKTEANMTVIKKRAIKGKVSLPTGIKISSPLAVEIWAGSYKTSVTLPIDGTAQEYTLKVAPNAVDSGYKVFYKIATNTELNTNGYYSNSGMTLNIENASLVDVRSSDRANTDITIIPKTSISGEIKLPNNNIATKEMKVSVIITNGTNTSKVDAKILEGTNSTPYLAFVPAGAGYTVKYEIVDGSFVKNGYYSLSGTVKDVSAAKQIQLGNENLTGIDLTLIGNTKIEGLLSIPSNRTTPASGLTVEIIATVNGIVKGSVKVKIPQNYKSVPYTLYVPPQDGYKINYKIVDTTYMTDGYYNSLATTMDLSNATILNAEVNRSQIDITLISKKAISGVISIPAGSEPKADFVVKMIAESGVNKGSVEVLIPYKAKTIPYTIYVPAADKYEVRYEIKDVSMFMNVGYYNKEVTTIDRSSTTLVNANNDIPNIDFTLIAKKLISGTVFLKNEFAPYKGIPVRIYACNDSCDEYIDVTIPEGSKSVSYDLYVPSGKEYILSYETQVEKYVEIGYFTEGGIVRDEYLADEIDASTENHVGKNITLIRNKEISGVISINNGTAPFGGVTITLEAENKYDYVQKTFIIPEGISSTTFKMYVPEGSGYKVYYSISKAIENFVTQGYYNVEGSVEDPVNATVIDVSYDNKSDVDINLISKYMISGSVSLPSGVFAPAGGLKIDVFATNSKIKVIKQFTISEKNNGVDYKIYVPYGVRYKVGYTISDDNYISGYYNAGGTVMSDVEGQSFNVDGEDVFGINMGIIQKRTISGKISIPVDAELPSSPISIDVSAGNVKTTVFLPKDKREVNYSLKLPPNKANAGYTLKYKIPEAVEEYITEGYFGLNGTVSNVLNSNLIDVSVNDKTDANLTLMKKRIIAGNIVTQGNKPAPSSGINVSVYVEGSSIEKKFNMIGGASSTPFKLYVNPGKDYKIKYVVNTQGTGYTTTAYYSSIKPALTVNEASLINVITEDRNDIQLTLVSHNSLSGKVLLNEAAPSGGLSINVSAQNDNKNFGTTEVIVPTGSKEAPYTLTVPPAANYKVYYSMQPKDKYVTSAFYSSTGTVLTQANATYLSTLEKNVTDINISPVLKKKISGTVSLPSGYKPTNSVKVKITATSGSYTETVSKDLSSDIPTVAYDIYLAPVSGYKISYQVINNADLVEYGFLTTDNSGLNVSKSTIFDLSKNDYSNANFSLLMNKEITGTLSILENAPAGGLDITVKASNRTYTKESKVVIPAGTNSLNYTLKVPPASGYILWYEVSPTTDYHAKGYYNGSQTTLEEASAKKIDVSSSSFTNANMKILNYNSIRGTISMPTNKVPAGGLKIEMIAKNNKNIRVKTYTIPESTGTVDFALYVPNGFGYKLYYTMPENDDFACKAYYSVIGTVVDESKAMGIDILSSSKSNVYMNIIVKKVISGTVSLQNDEKASSNTIVNVFALDRKNNGNSTRVIIPAGSNSVNYSMKVLPNEQGLGYLMKYETQYDYGFLKSGYYNASTSCRSTSNASLVDVSKSNATDINFTLKHYKTIKGKVILEKGVAPTNGIKVDVIAKNSVDTASTPVIIPQNSNYADYVIVLPPNDKGDDYILRYENWTKEKYLSIAYYNGSGTTRYENLAEKIDTSENDKIGADLTLSEKRIISGIISLPSGEVAPKDGLSISIHAKNSNDNGMVAVKIPEGKSYSDYLLYVPAGMDYQLSYEMPIINEYVMNGYYQSSGTVYKPSESEIIDLTSSDFQLANITIIKKKVVSGVVSLPEGIEAKEDINVNVIAETAGNTMVTIPKGFSSAQYSIYASPSVEGKGRKISYEISSTHGFVKTAYFSYQGMVRNSKLASDIVVNDIDQPGIDIKIVLPKKITGKVMLPDDKIAERDVVIKVTGDNGLDGESTTITIPEGSNSASYQLNLPPNDKGFEYVVKYENWADYMYTLYGYYNIENTTTILSQTDKVDINSNDAKDIDLKLMVRRTIKGNVNVPNDVVIPDEGLEVFVFAQNGLEEYHTVVNIPANGAGASFPYEIYVEDGLGYNLSYAILSSSSFMPLGYYSSKGTSADYKQATGVDVVDSGVSNKDLTLLIKQNIKGSVILPDTIENTDGVQVVVSAVSENGNYSSETFINEGSKTANFELRLPAGNGYKIKYEVKSNMELAAIGYYTEKETVRDVEKATSFDLTAQGLDKVDIKLLENRLIKGTIKLPVGVAPKNGFVVKVSATSDLAMTEKEFIIPEGENTVEFALSVMPVDGYKVKYTVNSEDYAVSGYYGQMGTELQQNLASSVDVSEDDATDINLLLVEKKELAGKIILPKDFVNSSGISVTVNAINVKTAVKDSLQVTIPKGENEKEYSIKVTPSTEGSIYNVYYQISAVDGLYETGYFNSSVTVPDNKLASPIDVKNGSYTTANITLIKSRKITGTVMLDGESAGANGAGISVYAEKTDYTGFRVTKYIKIEETKNSVKYELNVPIETTAIAKINVEASTNGKVEKDLKKYTVNSSIYLPVADSEASSDYKVGYIYTTANQLTNKYYQTGFYTSNRTAASASDADILNVANGDKAGIDLTIKQREKMISGTIKIPSTAVIPKEGIKLRVRALNEKLDYVPETLLAVANGQTSIAYEIKVPALENYHVQYAIVLPSTFEGFMESGYYGKEETKGKESNADSVNATDDVEGIDMELIPGKAVEGVIKLPATVNYDSFNIRVVMSNNNNEYSVTVPLKGKNEAKYKMYLPEGKDYVLRYDVSALFGEYISTSYYDVAGLTTDVRNAEKIEVNGNVLAPMMLLASSRTINGAVCLPKGNGEVGFTLSVPANDVNGGYNVRYVFESGKDLINKAVDGFYGANGTVKDMVNAKKIDVLDNNATNIKMPVMVEDYIALEGLVLNKKSVSIRKGESFLLTAKYYPFDAVNKMIEWVSENSDIARVTSDGKVIAIAQGETYIRAIGSDSIYTRCKVIVTEAVENGLSLDKSEIYINANESENLKAIIGEDVTVESVVWTSSNDKIVSVTEDGTIKAVGSGEVTITASSKDDPSIAAICKIFVIVPVSDVKITDSDVKIIAGENKKLQNTVTPSNSTIMDIDWSSSDTSVATIDDDGIVTAKKAGTATITATSIYNSSIKSSISITVLPVPVESVEIISNIEMVENDIITVKAKVLPLNVENRMIDFVSSDESKVVVVGQPRASSDGKSYEVSIQAKAPTSDAVTLTASSRFDNTKKAECKITVKRIEVKSLNIKKPDPSSVKVNKMIKIEAEVRPENATNKNNIVWSTDSTNVTVVGKGMYCEVTGKSAATSVTINAKLTDGDKEYTDSCIIEVKAEATPKPGTGTSTTGTTGTAGGTGATGATPTPPVVVFATATPTPKVTTTPTPTATPTATPKASSIIKIPTATPKPVEPSPSKKPSSSGSGIDKYTDIKGHWAYENFALLLEKGIIGGYSDNTLRPKKEITRAEMAKILVIAAGYEPSSSSNLTCKDKNNVPTWAKPYVKAAMDAKIITGYSDNTFLPNNKVTRKEMAVMVMKAFGYQEVKNAKLSFKDSNKVPNWAKGYVAAAIQAGIMQGYDDKTIRPDKTITRAEAVAMIARCIQE